VRGRGGARMRPLGIFYLYRVRLRARLVPEALAMVGIAVGVALLFASQVANTSLNGSVRQLTSGLVGQSRLQLEARSPQGFPESLLGEVQRTPGVKSAAPVLEAQVNVIGPAGSRPVDMIGADPRFVHLGGALLQHLSAAALARQRAFALPAPIAEAIGAASLQVVRLQVGARTIPSLLGVTLQESEIGTLVHSPVALAPLAYAQQLTGLTHRITRIFVQPQAGHDAEVRTALLRLADGHLNVDPADFDTTLFDNAAAPTDESTELFALISALVGFLFAFNAMLLTVPAKRALIADLRLDGYSQLTLIEVLLFDALVLGVLASLVGLALGDEISLRLFHASPGYLSFAFPVGSQRIVSWQSVVIAVGGGMLAACVGVLLPLRDVVAPTSHAPGGRSSPRRAGPWLLPLAGLGCLGLTGLILAFAPGGAVAGVVALTVALLLLLPSLIRGVLALVEHLTLDIRATAPFVAVNELRSPATWARTVAIAATGAIAVFGSVAIEGTRQDLERGLDASAKGIDSMADMWVTPGAESDAFATTPFAGASIASIAHVPGVVAVRAYRGGFLDYGARRVWVLAPSVSVAQPISATQFVGAGLALARRRLREHGWAVVSQALAEEHHLHVGESFTLPSPDPSAFRLAGVITNLGWPSGAIIVNAEDFARAWGSSEVSAYQVVLAAGTSAAGARGAVQRALGAGSGLTVVTAAQREHRHYEEASQGLSRLTTIRTLVLIASILAMAAAMGSMVWQRRARLDRLKLDGLSDLAVWRALLLESALLLGSGCSIGALFGLGGQLLGSHAILSVTGFPVEFSPGLLVALLSFLLVSTVAVIIAAIPGYYVARARPAAGLSD
jgi:putative ABC transport system permease protein